MLGSEVDYTLMMPDCYEGGVSQRLMLTTVSVMKVVWCWAQRLMMPTVLKVVWCYIFRQGTGNPHRQ